MQPLSKDHLEKIKDKGWGVRFQLNGTSNKMNAIASDQLGKVVATGLGANKAAALRALVDSMSTPKAKPKASKKKNAPRTAPTEDDVPGAPHDPDEYKK